VCATDVASGQRGKGVVFDPALVIGATVAVGTAYFAHTTAGLIGERADIGSGDFASLAGIGVSTTAIFLQPINSEAAIA
jgi:hypothetical protein